MSQTIDTRVVEMEFDNENFESNAKETMSTLDKLKEKLNFEGMSDGLTSFQKALGGISFDNVSDGIERVQVQFSALEVAGMTVISNLTTAAMNSVSQAASAIEGKLITGGLNRASNLESAKFKLEGMDVAWEDIKDDIDYGVADTAYSLDAAASAAAQFVASSVSLGDDMKTALRGISGVAAMTSSSYDDIANIFTTVAGNGRLYAQQLQQLSSRGLNAAATLADYLGKTESEVRDMVSAGKIDFETFSKAMDEAFGEHAKDANNTMSGVAANINSAFAKIGADFFEPIIRNEGELVDLLEAFREKINQLRKVIAPFSEAVVPIINSIIESAGSLMYLIDLHSASITDFTTKVSNSLTKINKFVQNFTKGFIKNGNAAITTVTGLEHFGLNCSEAIEALVEVANEAGIEFDGVAVSVDNFTENLDKGWVTIDVIKSAIEKLNAKFNIFGDTAESAAEATEQVSMTLEECEEVAKKVIHGDFGNGAERMEKLAEAGYNYATIQGMVNHMLLGTAYDESLLAESVSSTGDATEEASDQWSKLKENLQDSNSDLRAFMDETEGTTTIEYLVQALQDFGKAFKMIGDSASWAWDQVFGNGEAATDLSNVFNEAAGALAYFAKQLGESEEVASTFRNTFVGVFNILDTVRLIFVRLLRGAIIIFNALLGNTTDNLEDLSLKFSGTTGKIKEFVEQHDWITTVATKVADVITKVRDKLSEYAWVYEPIKNVIKWLLKNVYNFAKMVKRNIPTNVKDFAKLLNKLKEFGKLKIQDFIQGIEDLIGKFGELTGIDTSGLELKFDNLKTTIGDKLDSIGVSADDLQTKIDDLKGTFKDLLTGNTSIWDVVKKWLGLDNKQEGEEEEEKAGLVYSIAEKMGGATGALIDCYNKAKEFLANGKQSLSDISAFLTQVFETAFGDSFGWGDALATMAAGGIIFAIYQAGLVFINLLSPIIAITAVLQSMQKLLNQARQELKNVAKAIIIKELAEAVALLAAAFVAIAVTIWALPDDKAESILQTTGIVFACLSGVIGAFMLLATTSNPEKVVAFGKAMLLVCAALDLIMLGYIGMIKILDGAKIDRNALGALVILAGITMAAIGIIMAVSAYMAHDVLDTTKMATAMGMMTSFGKTFISMAVGVIALAAALKIVSTIDTEGLKKNIWYLVLVIAEIAGMMVAAAVLGKVVVGGAGMILAIAAAILLIIADIKLLELLSPEEITDGMEKIAFIETVLLCIVGMFATIQKGVQSSGVDFKGIARTLLALSAGVLLVSAAIFVLQYVDINASSITYLVLIFIGLIAAIVAMERSAKGISEAKTTMYGIASALVGVAVAIALIAAVMLAISVAMNVVGTGAVLAATLAVFAILIGFGYILKQISKITPDSKAAGVIASIAAIILALGIAVAAIVYVTGDNWATAAVVMGGMIAIIAILLVLAKSFMKFSQSVTVDKSVIAVLVILAATVVALGVVLYALSTVPLSNLPSMLVGMLCIVTIMGVMYLLLQQLNQMYNISTQAVASVAVLSLCMVGIGLVLALLSQSNPESITTAALALVGIMLSLTVVLYLLNNMGMSATGLLSLAASIVSLAGSIALLGAAIAVIAIGVLIAGEVIVGVINTVIDALDKWLGLDIEKIEGPLSTVMDDIATGMKGITDSMPSSDETEEAMAETTKGVENGTDDLEDAGETAGEATSTGFLSGLTSNLNFDSISSAITNALGGADITSMMSGALGTYDITSSIDTSNITAMFTGEGGLTSTLTSGMSGSMTDMTDLANSYMAELPSEMSTALTSDSDNYAEYTKSAETLSTKWTDSYTDTTNENIQGVADNTVDGLVNGINSSENQLKAFLSGVGTYEAYEAGYKSKQGADIGSPSKKAYVLGMYTVAGLANGIADNAYKIKESGVTMAKDSLTAMSTAISDISDGISTDQDFNPTITPVLDLSQIQNGAGAISGMFGNQTLAIAGANSALMNSRLEARVSSGDLLSAITNLGSALSGNGNINTYNVNGVTYDDGSNISNAVKTIVRATTMQRRA